MNQLLSSEKLLIIFLFFLSLAVKLLFLYKFSYSIAMDEGDAISYFAIAKSISQALSLGNLSTHHTPFYPILLAFISIFTDDIELGGRLVSIIMGALLVFPAYLTCRELYGKKIAILSTLLIIFLWDFVLFSIKPLTQATYITILMTSIYIAVILTKKHSIILSLLLGLTLGALYLTRPEGFIVFPYIAVIIGITTGKDKYIAIKSKFILIAVMIVGFSIMAVPYINYLHEQLDIWVISGKTAAMAHGEDGLYKLLPDGETVGQKVGGAVKLSEAIPKLGELLPFYWGNVVEFSKIVPKSIPAIYLPLILLGFFISLNFFAKDKCTKKLYIFQLSILLGCVVAVLPVFLFEVAVFSAFILPIFLLMTILLPQGLIYVENIVISIVNKAGIKGGEMLRKWSFLTFAVVVYFSSSSVLGGYNRMMAPWYNYEMAGQAFIFKETGEWLKTNTPKKSTVMTRWTQVTFYADRKLVALPSGEVGDVIEYAKSNKVDFIVIDSFALSRGKDAKLVKLLDPYSHHSSLKVVYLKEKFMSRVIIYKVMIDNSM